MRTAVHWAPEATHIKQHSAGVVFMWMVFSSRFWPREPEASEAARHRDSSSLSLSQRRSGREEAWSARRCPCRSAGPGERKRGLLVASPQRLQSSKHRVECVRIHIARPASRPRLLVRGLETIAGPEGLRPTLRLCPSRGSPRHPRRSGGTPLGFPLGGVACSSLSLSQRRPGREEAWSARRLATAASIIEAPG